MDQALSPAFAPFTFALALMVGIMVLELASTVLGLSLHGGDTHLDLSADMADLHASFDLDLHATPDLHALMSASTALDSATSHAPEIGLLGLGSVPLMIWLATALLTFAVTGYFLQGVVASLTGHPLPMLLALAPALIAALILTRSFARHFARLLPATETTATTAQFMGGLRGVVTQGTARLGQPAEVRVRDRHGNLHYLRCEPFRAGDVIAEGSDVLTLRQRLGPDRWGLRILPLP